ncbi:MAG: 5-formyltetrahydrofolate cyclo-ligase [Gammaproteobacteria bacterium]|nr:5-formyltetrahydrofolate cyclo-ligase [Gammaproteobacteria bacterium]
MLSIDEEKRLLRIQAKQQRGTAFALNPSAGTQVCDLFLQSNLLKEAQIVSVYWPLGDELDPIPLLTTLHSLGHHMVLPVMLGAGQPLIFRSWTPGDTLQDAGFGTREPSKDKQILAPDVILAPLLAFDKSGYRLGYGGGFYDRTLEKLRKTKPVSVYGVAYAAQEMEHVIKGPYDQPLDGIITELNVTLFNH